MCKFSSKSGGVPFQPLGDLTWNDPAYSCSSELGLQCTTDRIMLYYNDTHVPALQ